MTNASEVIELWLKDIDPSLSLGDKGKVFLTSESGVELMITTADDSGHLIINSEIIDIPASDSEALFKKALEYNLYQEKTLGGAVAVDGFAGIVCLSLSREVEFLDSISFQNIVQNVINTTNKLKDEFLDLYKSQLAPISPEVKSTNALFI